MAAQHDHGHTPAAWTGAIIAFVGFCTGGAFMVAAKPVGFWASLGLILLGAVVGGVMKLMGLGNSQGALVHSDDSDARSQSEEKQIHANV